MRISTTTATEVATARSATALALVPSQYSTDARRLFGAWVAAAGTEDEQAAAQAIVDAGREAGVYSGQWAAIDSVLSALFTETPQAERWSTSGGVHFDASGIIRTTPAQTTAPEQATAPEADAEISDAQMFAVLDRIAAGVERVASALER